MYLSKSRFIAGLQCHKQLWWRVHEPDAAELVPDAQQQAIFDQGTRVGELAQEYVPGGQLVDLPHHAFEERILMTRNLLDRGVHPIYEASFSADDLYAAVDILEQSNAGFSLIEVKSSTRVKKQHIPDVAFQLYLTRRTGLDVSKAELMHLNRACTYPDLKTLFLRQDVTTEVEAVQAKLPELIASQLRTLEGELPDVPIGPHCKRPYDCPFMTRCWRDLPQHHVSTLYRVRKSGADLVAEGFSTIDQLPAEYCRSPVQARQRRAVETGSLIVESGLEEALQAFRDPIAFLDFETVALAIPVWDGCHPYDAIPVQFSCHHRSRDGTIIHHEWLPEGPDDPRTEMARHIVDACRGAETVVAYNAGFERRGLELLARSVPRLADELLEIAGRLADPLPLVRNHVYHPDFGGSFSLKTILPVLVPDLGYSGLEIAGGDAASVALKRLMFSAESLTPGERSRLSESLRRYCALDTMAMVRLLDRLKEIAAEA